MDASQASGIAAPSLAHGLAHAARHYLGGRRGLLVLAGVVVVAGAAALNWSWLAAVGVAPLLLAVLPCAAMCALGLCVGRMGGGSCSPQDGAPDDAKALPSDRGPSFEASGSVNRR
jgi:hypothetical protein